MNLLRHFQRLSVGANSVDWLFQVHCHKCLLDLVRLAISIFVLLNCFGQMSIRH